MDPEQLSSRHIDLWNSSISTHITDVELDIDRIDELIASRNGNFVFVRSQDKNYYQMLDLLTGKLIELNNKEYNFEHFNEFRLFPLDGNLIFYKIK